MGNELEYSIVIPTYNGGDLWAFCARAITLQCPPPKKVVVVDSSSVDKTRELALDFGFEVRTISSDAFDHGGTRAESLKSIDTPYVVFLTQDALLKSSDSAPRLVEYLEKNNLSSVYGRQVPHQDASSIAAHAREYNYLGDNRILSKKDISWLGIRAAFCSNSFSAYNIEDLKSIGSFPKGLIFGEDMYVTAKLLLDGKKTGYCAEAIAAHSHNYTFSEEFRRYFDIGVYHSREYWLLEKFGGPSSEGKRFVVSEVKYLLKRASFTGLLSAAIRTFTKYIAYRLGRNEKTLPMSIKLKLSMNKKYWKGTVG